MYKRRSQRRGVILSNFIFKMEAKFYKDIEQSMRIKTLKDFELELRTKINNELELERKKNQDLSRILLSYERDLWEKLRDGGFNWLVIPDEGKVRLSKLIDLYSQFRTLVENVKDLNTKLTKIKQLKNGDDNSGGE